MPIGRLHPGRILREEYLEPGGLDVLALADLIGVETGRVRSVVEEQAPITPDLALRLARCFGTTAQFWLNLQSAHSLWIAEATVGAEIRARVQPLAA
jgi:antitoxin HigA-1